jgi:phage portal protein BeeE
VRIFGWEVSRTKAAVPATTFPADFPGITRSDGWFSTFVHEAFPGAFQRNIGASSEDALGHPTFWACVTLIAGDIAKCGFSLVKEDNDGITVPVVENSPFLPVLRRPNHYQNRIQLPDGEPSRGCLLRDRGRHPVERRA